MSTWNPEDRPRTPATASELAGTMVEDNLASRSVKVTVHPATADPEGLTVADALHQILDAVGWFERVEDSVASPRKIVWGLTRARTNSPRLTVVATPFARDRGNNIETELDLVISRAGSGLTSLAEGVCPPWIGPGQQATLRRKLTRSLNGVGPTDIVVGNRNAVRVSSHLAKAASATLDQKKSEVVVESGEVTHQGAYLGILLGRLHRRLCARPN